jgi:hypothetical protein
MVGLRCTIYVFGPIAYLVIVLSATLTAFGLGSGRGFGLHPNFLRGFGILFGSALYGVFLGAVFGLIGSAMSRVGIGSSFASLRRLFRLRPKPEKTIAPPRPRRWRWLWISLWLAGSFALLTEVTAFGVGVYLGGIVDRKLADAVTRADHDDPNWRVDDLMAAREPVPDDENSALVVAEVVSLLPESWPVGPSPAPGQPKPPLSEVVQAFERLVATEDNVQLDEQTADVLRRELDEHTDAVRLARTLANYDRGRHELVLGSTLINTLLPETQGSRTPARLMEVDAALQAQNGDLDGAIDSTRAVFGSGRSIGDEPFLISHLVRTAIGHVALKTTYRTLGQGEPSDEALARLQSLVLNEMGQPLLLHGLKGEMAMHVEVIRRISNGEMPITALSDGGPSYDPSAPPVPIAPWGRLMFENQLAVEIEWMNEIVAIARRPPVERQPLWKAWEAEVDQVRHSRFGYATATLPLLLTPAIRATASALSRYQAELGSAAILLAAERHRRKTGAWPASIAEIDPAILSDPPLDPYTGEPFRMERVEGQVIVHSIGPNLKDERGAYDPKRWNDEVLDDVGARAWDVSLRRQPAPSQRP